MRIPSPFLAFIALNLIALSCRAADPAPAATRVDLHVDWAQFLGQHDLIWQTLPADFDTGAFLGNGLLGAMIYREGDNHIRWEMGRTDVTEHRRDNTRLPIGGLVLTTVGKIQGGTMRLDLWNAEVRGTVTTDHGTISFRSFIHTDIPAMVTDLQTTDGEKTASLKWDARPCIDRHPNMFPGDPPNPPSTTTKAGSISVCSQLRAAGGEFATAWAQSPIEKGHRVVLSIADTFPATTAAGKAVSTVKQVQADDFNNLLESHRAWWHAFYPKSFVSIPDPKLESFYWIQWYKLACASRPNSEPVDEVGPWYRFTEWPRIWWNLNIQILYLPTYTGNHLELDESFINFIDKKRNNFFRNGREMWHFDACATTGHSTDYEGLRGDGNCEPDMYKNPGDFTWALQNYYLHYRYTMDHSMVTDQHKHAFYPLLKGSVNLYMKILKKGPDGKLHLPSLMSPEYGMAEDNNFNLALVRWGCQTLLALNKRYNLHDPQVANWEETLADLVPPPIDDTGLEIGANTPLAHTHRHWSHMLSVHPLHILSMDVPANRELIQKSIEHWLTIEGGAQVYGWSNAGAASIYATLGEGDNAIQRIHMHMADQRFVRSNTMYYEGFPVVECSISLNRSLEDMLLQSWGDKINVFPAIPSSWQSAVFDNLRAEGAFLVSANRADGQTQWVRIKSLAGEPCRVKAVFSSAPKMLLKGQTITLKSAANDDIYDLPLARGDEAVLYAGDQPPALVVTPQPISPADCNQWGLKNAN
jgi:hypothetical protein